MDINVEKLLVKYNQKTALDVENLSFHPEMIYCILGLNGSGKSTFLNCIAGIEEYEGKITYNGRGISDERRGISIMLQKPYMFNTTVYDNIGCGLKFRKTNKKIIEEKIYEYEKYFGLNDLMNKNARALSGGETSKAALLRCAVLETEVTLLDEPTASMDIESTIKAESLIKSMKDNKRMVILITHDLYQAERLSDYVIFMDKGRVIEQGAKDKLFKAPEHPHVKAILRV